MGLVCIAAVSACCTSGASSGRSRSWRRARWRTAGVSSSSSQGSGSSLSICCQFVMSVLSFLKWFLPASPFVDMFPNAFSAAGTVAIRARTAAQRCSRPGGSCELDCPCGHHALAQPPSRNAAGCSSESGSLVSSFQRVVPRLAFRFRAKRYDAQRGEHRLPALLGILVLEAEQS